MAVFLVGAGPGDPGLLTLRGRDLLALADVVLYDALVGQAVLDMAAPQAVRVDVGKVAGAKCVTQATINELLVAYGRTVPCVVRLKGGDPFVFGRGGEEALALHRAGVPFEIVPGVSSAIAAPAAAGIPVTHRGVAASVAIVTGHEADAKDAAVDWAKLATATDTLVVLMGMSRLAQIVDQLVVHGRPPDTPAAIVSQGTTTQQRAVFGTLRDLPVLARAAAIQSPAAIVVGDVVCLAAALSPHPNAFQMPSLPAVPLATQQERAPALPGVRTS